ncbi:hypothetical protein CDAR_15761 [Caerostris darwini]|uniref:Uncharacterized protein n=1 Tax=Caerostris darwini TaxID=1538125 RepID=A0AAV4N6V2_9ARAC|nr:hypothetical protein CDAR_15761 [Caerostris darwini]
MSSFTCYPWRRKKRSQEEDEEKSTFLFNDSHFLPSLEICAERSSILLKRCDTGVTGSLQSPPRWRSRSLQNKLFSGRLTEAVQHKFGQLRALAEEYIFEAKVYS